MTKLIAWLIAAPDRFWESLQARWPILYSLDNRDWKTWIAHTVVTLIAGHLIAWATPLSVPQGLTLMVAFYVFREAWNILHEGNRKYGDAFMDAAVPMLVVLLWIQAVR